MFCARKAVCDIEDVPVTWIYEYYLKLSEKLTGQDVKLKSKFNLKDSNPSMYVYVCRKSRAYKYKCFSTGLQGNHINLIMTLYELEYKEAVLKIVSDYRAFLEDNLYEPSEIILEEKWIVEDYTLRQWTKDDASFWSPYNIGSQILNKYNVKPIDSFTMSKGAIESFHKKSKRIYGYFTKEDELYRLYQPEVEAKKFLIIKNYLQGWDQITGESRLFICSSLKDMMTMNSLISDADYIAPNSENAGIEYLMQWIQEYPEKYIIFDNDDTGIKMMKKYDEVYNIPYIHIPLSKDVSDSVKEHGASKVKSYLKTLLPV